MAARAHPRGPARAAGNISTSPWRSSDTAPPGRCLHPDCCGAAGIRRGRRADPPSARALSRDKERRHARPEGPGRHRHAPGRGSLRRLEELGVYERERRPWLPHVTVVRFREAAPPGAAASRTGGRSWLVPDAAVYLSRLRSTGAEYFVVESFCLGRGEVGEVDREQALDVALGQIERQFGKGAVMKMNDHAAVSIGAISTGSLALISRSASEGCRAAASSRSSARSRRARRRSSTT